MGERFVVIWFASLLIPILAMDPTGVPFPSTNGNQQGISPLGGFAGKSAIEAAQRAGDFTASGFDGVWDALVSPNSPLYTALIDGLKPLAAVGFLIWATLWARDMFHQGFSVIPSQKIIWPVVIILLLSNNGFLLAGTTLGGRIMISNTNTAILSGTYDGIQGRQHVQSANIRLAYNTALENLRKACKGRTDEEQERCFQKADAEALKIAQALPGGNSGLPRIQGNPLQQAGALIGQQFKLALEGIIIGLLATMSGLFRWFFAYVLVIWASTGPFWVSITLLPYKTRGIPIFFSGYLAIGLTILSYTVINIGAAVSLAFAGDGDPLLYPLVTGFLGPLLAIGIGAGSAVGSFVGIAGLSATLVKKAVGG